MGEVGDDPDPSAMTEAGMTEPGAASEHTEAHTAWSFSDDYDEIERRRRWAPWVVAAAVVIAVLATAATIVLIVRELKPEPAQSAPTSSMIPAAPPSRSAASSEPSAAPTPPPRETVTVQAPPPPAPRRPAPRVMQTFTTYLSWTGGSCIDVRVPNGPSMSVDTTCNAGSDWVKHDAYPGELVGVDPIIGNATSAACRVVAPSGRVLASDSGTLGDGHDINCIVTVP